MAEVIRMPDVADTIDLRYIQGEAVDAIWSEMFSMVEPACDETLTPRDLYQMLAENKALGWVMSEDDEILACAVTRVRERHGNRWLDVMAIGGRDWDKWAGLLNTELERYGRQTECHAVSAHVRRGLEKWLGRLGWRVRQVHMEYRIDG